MTSTPTTHDDGFQNIPLAFKERVDVVHLKVGMYVCELDRPWLDSPFLLQGFHLISKDDIEEVQKHCSYVYVDVKRSTKNSVSTIVSKAAQNRAAKPNLRQKNRKKQGLFSKLQSRRKSVDIPKDIARPIQTADNVFDNSQRLVRNIFDDIRLGSSIDTTQAKETVKECVNHVLENASAMLLLSNVKNKDHYTSEHCLNVAIFSIVIGRQLGFSKEQLEEVGMCGLLHDVGKVLTPDEILKKPGRLTPEEFLVMKMHPTQGRDILMSNDGLLRSALHATHAHHERLDGTGYPRGLHEDQLSIYTKIVAVADSYDAITSHRVYSKAHHNAEAFKILQSESGNHYDARIVSKLIRSIGIFPPGTTVKLSNGEIAVVVKENPKQKLKPKVLVVKDSKCRPVTPRYIDLGENKAKVGITKLVSADKYGIDMQLFRSSEFLQSIKI